MATIPRILLVCSGNEIRSPLAEMLLRRALRDAADLHSAGTTARAGTPMTEPAQKIAQQLGVPHPEAHTSHVFDRGTATDNTLVLTAAREHRAKVVETYPRARRHTFTLREFARIAAHLPPETSATLTADTPRERLEQLADAAARYRGYVPSVDPADDDIIDPIGRGAHEYDLMAHQLVVAIDAILHAVGVTAPWGDQYASPPTQHLDQ